MDHMPPQRGMVEIPAGAYRLGSDADEGEPSDGEAPSRIVQLHRFRMARTAVSNRDFARFINQTGYVSLAEETGLSFVFAGLLPDDFPPTRGVVDAPWWREVEGACWYQPEGPGSSIDTRADHPVVHVSWHDAMAYCRWAGARLPTDAEWECAARGGLHQNRFAWGDDLTPNGQHRCNIWQGRFPMLNSTDDGYYGTAPVDAFEPNGYGLFNVCGNVWEWCADWFDNHFSGADLNNPRGPVQGHRRVIRGGSFLCHESYCNRYRVAARSSNTPDATTSHTGFRCAADLPATADSTS
jgi:formylglycine-generating enzyme required for sulfatase activity